MTDISNAVMAAMNDLVASGKIEAAIEKQIETTIKDLLQEHMRPWSEFGKALSEHVKRSIGVDCEKITLPEYNAIVADIVRRKVDAFMQLESEKQLVEVLDKILEKAPETMKFSALVDEFKEWAAEHWECDAESDTECTVLIEGDARPYSSRWVHMDRKADQDKYKCEFSFLIGHDGMIGALRFRGRNPKDDIFIGGYWGFERSLFGLHAAKTKLIVDSFDTTMPEREAA